jgi:hypothetical protein
MHIWVALDKPEWSWHPCLFPWILGHEVGHAALSQQFGDSDNDHTRPVWQTWPSHLGEVCFPEG